MVTSITSHVYTLVPTTEIAVCGTITANMLQPPFEACTLRSNDDFYSLIM